MYMKICEKVIEYIEVFNPSTLTNFAVCKVFEDSRNNNANICVQVTI